VKRKHHCRICGGVFCGPCTSKKLAVTNPKKKERVCDKCFASSSEQDTSRGKVVVKKKKGSKIGGRGSQVEGLRPTAFPTSSIPSQTESLHEDDVPIWWYMDVEDKEQGPCSKRQLASAWQSRQLDKSCWVWNKGMKEWAQITTIDNLYTYLRSVPMPSTGTGYSPTSSSPLSPTQTGAGMTPVGVPALSPTPYTMMQPTTIPQQQPMMAQHTAMMPSAHVSMEPIGITHSPKKSWFNWNKSGHQRLLENGGEQDGESEARKEMEIEQFNATRVHLIYSAVWFFSTAGLVLLIGILGAEGWFPTFMYMTIFYNILSFFLVWYDRCLEFRRSHVRISEGLLFLYMWWAGFVGAWLAFFCFNHKYQNVTFTAKAIAITILNLFWVAIYVNSLGLDATDDDGGGGSD
jgi:uncharacterized membrane protein YsdA (DUF1294 family)